MGLLLNKLTSIKQTREVGKLLKDIAEILDTLEGIDCYIERTGNRWKINASPAGGGATIPDGTEEYQVLRWDDTEGEWIADWVRAVDLT